MKTSSTVFYKVISLIVSIIFSASFLHVYAQPSNSSIDSNADKYKLIFAPGYDGKLRFTADESAAQMRARYSSVNNFIKLLNQAGEQGYKVVSVLGNDFAVVKLDETPYEYDWFETTSPFHFSKGDIGGKLSELSQTGFRVIHHSLLSGNCEPIDKENPAMGENCSYLDFFLAEKEKGGKKPVKQILVSSSPGWGAKPSVELEKQIEDSLAEGFYPVNVFSAFEVLLEKAKTKDELLSDKPDVQVVRSSWGKGDVEDKVNELAKQGYRLAMTSNRIAVLYRNKETAQIPVTYVWLNSDKKNFEKELAKLQAKGAIYKTIYPSERGKQNTLIFEQRLNGDGVRAEFKILKLEFATKENKAENKVYVDLTPSSKETLKTMNKLVKEGFEVRDLFMSDGVGVILERVK